MDSFLADCTSKLKLLSGARCLYDWSGRIVHDLAEVPVLGKVLQPASTSAVVVGPVWVTTGETFSPRGVYSIYYILLRLTFLLLI